ncbi:MAG: 3'-5' exonuclease [Candidatus Altiarchaeota archaeon]|nr:3'-5' exonuclease [Candidatus Altiarchaeota archaeon]
MTYLIFDTETTGKPRDYNAPVSDSENWPRLVQIAWLQYDSSGKQTGSHEHIIKPQGFVIPDEVVRIHGISTKRATREGLPLGTVLNEFSEAVKQSMVLVAHNIEFDEKIVRAELFREDIPDNLVQIKKICTMRSSTDFCRLPGSYGYKWPTLADLYARLFSTDFEGAHNAVADVAACARSFFELKRLEVIRE